VPIAAWRVHTCAARNAAAQGRTGVALDHQSRAASVINRLAESMATSDGLRRTFLASRDVQAGAGPPDHLSEFEIWLAFTFSSPPGRYPLYIQASLRTISRRVFPLS